MEKRRLLYIILGAFCLALFLFMVVAGITVRQERHAPVYYKQGLEFYKKGDFQNAYYNFSKVHFLAKLYLNAVYYQAKCADALDDNKTAIKKYTILKRNLKNEYTAPYFLWRLGKLGKKQEFVKLKENYPATEYGIASNFELAKLTKDNAKKKEYLLEYIRYSPNGRFIKEVLKEMTGGEFELADTEKIILAECLYSNGKYIKAVNILKNAPIELSWVSLIKTLDKLNSQTNVIKVGKKGVSIDNSNFDENSLEVALDIYLKYSNNKTAVLNEIYNSAPDRRIKGLALYKLILTGGQSSKKGKLVDSFPDLKYAPETLFELFIDAIANGKTPLALKYGKRYLSRYNGPQAPAVLYFTALIKKRALDNSCKDEVSKLLSDYPQSYYAYLAYSKIANKNFSSKRALKITSVSENRFPIVSKDKTGSFFENFALYGDFSAYEDFRINDLLVQSWIEHGKGNRALSAFLAGSYIKEAEILPPRNHPVWKLAYPIYYKDEINEKCDKYGLNPYLMLSLIKEESHFNPKIASGAGAVGLAQLMPATAAMIGGKQYTTDELKNPNLSIELGAKYFAHLMELFSNDEPLCILSYNSGPNAVKRWLGGGDEKQFDIMVEKIPYLETKTYIKKVYGAYWNYLLTYGVVKL